MTTKIILKDVRPIHDRFHQPERTYEVSSENNAGGVHTKAVKKALEKIAGMTTFIGFKVKTVGPV